MPVAVARLAMIPFELLRIFVAVAEGGSIAAAAKRENLAPSIASRKIATLERQLGTKLFIRTTRRIQLTGAGRICLTWARDTLTSFSRVTDDINALKGQPAGLVRIACNEYLESQYLLETLTYFRQRHPAIRFIVTTSDRPAALLEQGYDIALHGGPVPEGHGIGRRIRTYRRILCAAPEYLAGRPVPKTPADLTQHCILAHSRNEPRHWFFRQSAGRIISQPLDATIEVNSYPLLFQTALNGLGIARLAEGPVLPYLKSGRLIELLGQHRSVNADGSDPAIWLLYASRHLSHSVRLCGNHLITHLKIQQKTT
jgi:DNA-binding transcriptional LysR family regulator